MKKAITLFALLFTILSIGQPVRDMASDPVDGERKNGYYIKDTHNYFGPFIGAWSYTNGNTEFRIFISKIEKSHRVIPEHNIDYYRDGLEIRYEKYENGQLVFASPQLGFVSGFAKEAGVVEMSFVDYEREDYMVSLTLKKVPTGLISPGGHYNKISFKLDTMEARNVYFDSHPNEPFFSVPDNIEMVWYPQ